MNLVRRLRNLGKKHKKIKLKPRITNINRTEAAYRNTRFPNCISRFPECKDYHKKLPRNQRFDCWSCPFDNKYYEFQEIKNKPDKRQLIIEQLEHLKEYINKQEEVEKHGSA